MIQAIMDRVFVKLPEEKATTDGGIFLCDGFANQRTTGKVVSVGKEVKSVKVGDKILFHVFDDLPMPEKDVVALRENSILGVFEDE